ncbi:MAG: DUF4390 domain-containing protein [Azonexus sp.]|nr:DUF4390 domain-containing protein [Azonexus sp.]
MPNTMVSTTVFLKSMAKRLHRWLLLLVFMPFLAWTAEIDITSPQISATDDGYALSADFNFELNQRLEEAVTKGLMLYFVADFELSKERWYWLDEKLMSRSQTYRLSYHALTRQYRLSIGSGLHQSFSSLPEAMAVLTRLRHWQVADKSDKGIRIGEPVQAALRFRLDVAQLPKPFQITSLGNKDWSLSSDWKIWQVTLPAIAVENK